MAEMILGCDGNKVPVPEKPHLDKKEYKDTFKTCLIIGGDGGLGLELIKLLTSSGCDDVYSTSRKVDGSQEVQDVIGKEKIIGKIDMEDDDAPERLVNELKKRGVTQIHTYIHSAGYFTTESFLELNRNEQKKMYNICAIAPIFFTQALVKSGLLKEGSKIGYITSEGGSIGLRTLEEGGGNFGHHGSKAANNMGSVLLAWDLYPYKIPVVAIHPSFMRTKMTADKYAHVYERFNAITAREVAPYILQPIVDVTLETTGRFVGATGNNGLGLGEVALPLKLNFDAYIPAGGQLPF